MGEGALDSEVTLGYPRDSPDRASAPRARGGAAVGKSGHTPMALTPRHKQKQSNLHAYTPVIKTMY